MNARKRHIIESFISHRCLLIEDEVVSLANMSNNELMAAYNLAQQKHYEAQQRALAFQMGIANSARTIYDSGVDVTRPLFGDDPDSKVYMPGTKSWLSKSEFKKLSNAIVNNGEYDGIKGAANLRKHYGMDKSWANKNTTDNTCAAFACAAIDHASSEAGMQDVLFTDSKNLSPDQWNNLINQNVYFDTDEYKHSVSKIYKAINKKDKNPNYYKNQGNWSTFDSVELANQDPNYASLSDKEKLDYVRSAEFWDQHMKPGDMILYYDENGKQRHVALAGHENRQLYHDGSSVYTPQGRGEKEKSTHATVRGGMNFKIIRYTNTANIDNTQNNLDQIAQVINNREGFQDSYALNDQGQYEYQPIVLPTQDIQTVDNTQKDDDVVAVNTTNNQSGPISTINKSDRTNTTNKTTDTAVSTINKTDRTINQADMRNKPFTKFYNWIKGTFSPKNKQLVKDKPDDTQNIG